MKQTIKSVILLAAAILFIAPAASSQQRIRNVAEKIQNLNDPKMTMTNVMKRNDRTREVTSKILEVGNLPAKYTKEMLKAIEKDEKEALTTDKYIRRGFCTRVLKFKSNDCTLSVAMTYNMSNNVAASLVIREDYTTSTQKSKRNTRTRIIYSLPSAPAYILEEI